MKNIGGFLKSAWVVFWWISATLILFIPIFITGFFGKKGIVSYRFCQIWVWIGKTVCFSKVHYEFSDKIDRSQSYIIASNHQSFLDIPALMLMGIPFRWVLKKEIGKVPLFGWALYGARHIFIDRSKPKQAMKSMTTAIKRLAPGTSVAIFPEGTRSASGAIGDFKLGGFVTAIDAGLPILPITINGSWRTMPNKNSLAFVPGHIQVIVGDPIDMSAYSKQNVTQLMNDTKEAIASKLDPEYPNNLQPSGQRAQKT